MVDEKYNFNFEKNIIIEKIVNEIKKICYKNYSDSDSETDLDYDSEFISENDSDSEYDSKSENESKDNTNDSKIKLSSIKNSRVKMDNSSKFSKSYSKYSENSSVYSNNDTKIKLENLSLKIKENFKKQKFIIKQNNKVRNIRYFLNKNGLNISKVISNYTEFKLEKFENNLYVST